MVTQLYRRKFRGDSIVQNFWSKTVSTQTKLLNDPFTKCDAKRSYTANSCVYKKMLHKILTICECFPPYAKGNVANRKLYLDFHRFIQQLSCLEGRIATWYYWPVPWSNLKQICLRHTKRWHPSSRLEQISKHIRLQLLPACNMRIIDKGTIPQICLFTNPVGIFVRRENQIPWKKNKWHGMGPYSAFTIKICYF